MLLSLWRRSARAVASRYLFLFVAFSIFLQSSTAQYAPPLLLRFPTVSKTQIVFNYADDLWIVSRDGGDARRLTSGVGIETLPHFSPDGSMIAFTGEYDGNRDVYVVRGAGGVPRRLTYHPADEYVAGLDSRRQEDSVQLVGQQLHALRGSALHGSRRGRISHAAAASHRRGRLVLARWNAPRVRAASQVAAGLEALPRRPDHARSGSPISKTPA